MKAVSMLSQDEFTELFNNRNHNPPEAEADFDDEFNEAVSSVERILLRHAAADDFLLWSKPNRARFIDTAFSSEAYLQRSLVEDIQRWQRSMREDWMVSLWEVSFLFVTRNRVLCFAPLPDDPALLDFIKSMEDPEWQRPSTSQPEKA